MIFPTLKTFFNENVENGLSSAIDWLYPNGVYDPNVAINNTILSATNEEGKTVLYMLCVHFMNLLNANGFNFIIVDAWNDRIGELNLQPEHELVAECSFGETDDIHGYLANIMTEDTMELFDRTGIPPHTLKLKV